MRLRLVGYSGERPPVPGTQVVNPEDPEPTPDPVPDPDDIPDPLVVVLNDGDVFNKGTYLAMGYNRFDVMCIGGAGGRAGNFKQLWNDLATANVDGAHGDLVFTSYKYGFGGAGGGGGVHRVKGRLALLPTNVPVVVGQAGADGAFVQEVAPGHDWRDGEVHYANPVVSPGGDGGVSSFGGVICRASGGKGGVGLSGGAGGLGNAANAGGGPVPAYIGGSRDPSTGTTTGGHPNPGTWDGKIGSGGAGGAGSIIAAFGGFASGGAGRVPGSLGPLDGATGAFSGADQSVSGKGDFGQAFGIDYTRVAPDPSALGYNYLVASHYDAPVAIPGSGGGATLFPLTGDLTPYGSKVVGRSGAGAVVVRLTYAIV